MKKTFLKAAIPTLAMLLVAIMALTGTTYAWFTVNDTAKVSTISVKLTDASAINIATTSTGILLSEWKSTLTEQDIAPGAGNKIVKEDVEPMSTVTGKSFVTCTLDADGNVAESKATAAAIEFDVFLYNDSNTAKTVSMASSSVSGQAARVAVFSYNTVTYADGKPTSSALVNDNSEVTSKIYTKNTSVKGLSAVPPTGAPVPEGATVANATSDWSQFSYPIGAHALLKLHIVCWTEGQDPACTNALANTDFGLDLVFNSKANPPS